MVKGLLERCEYRDGILTLVLHVSPEDATAFHHAALGAKMGLVTSGPSKHPTVHLEVEQPPEVSVEITRRATPLKGKRRR